MNALIEIENENPYLGGEEGGRQLCGFVCDLALFKKKEIIGMLGGGLDPQVKYIFGKGAKIF
jgi:hypothetical protein